MTLLVLLPVAAMVAGITIFRTTQPTLEDEDVARMGRADLIAYGIGRDELATYLPAGSIIEPLSASEGVLILPGARPSVQLNAMDLDGLAAGMRNLVDGRLPVGVEETAITNAIAKLADVSIGGQLTLEDGPTVTVVGIVENPMYLGDMTVLLDPDAITVGPAEFASWLIGVPAGTDPQAIVDASFDPETGVQAVLIHSRESGRLQAFGRDGTSGYVLVLGALALVEAALIASAAFAVSIRRRQRELGLLAAIGATPKQLAGTVVAEAIILGTVACAGGVVVGLLGALGMSPWLDELTQRRNPSLVIDLGGLVAPATIGFLAATIAAVTPARTVARVPVLLALSGRRPPQSSARGTLRIGLFNVGLAATMTVVGATMPDAGADPVSILLLAGGAILSVLGFGACSPWILERLGRLANRLPLAGRIAFRDTARSRSRSSPIVTAILAGCAVAIAIGAWVTSRDAENLAGWRPNVYPDQIALNGPASAVVGQELLDDPGVVGGMSVPLLVPEDPDIIPTYQFPDARDENGKLIDLTDQCMNCNPEYVQPYYAWMVAGATPELLEMSRAESATYHLRQGRAVLIAYRPLTATYLEILFDRETSSTFERVRRVTLPVHVMEAKPYGTLPQLFLPDETIADLGLVVADEAQHEQLGGPSEFVVLYDHDVNDADRIRAREAAAKSPDTFVYDNTPPERAGEGFRIAIIALVLLFAVSVTGIAIALGEAESRPEQRSLLALGADPRLRRHIAAARAAVVALLAGVLAVPAGLLPIWGMFVSRGSPVAVPTLEIAGALVALPLLAILSSWLLSRPIPDWAAFRSMGTGQ